MVFPIFYTLRRFLFLDTVMFWPKALGFGGDWHCYKMSGYYWRIARTKPYLDNVPHLLWQKINVPYALKINVPRYDKLYFNTTAVTRHVWSFRKNNNSPIMWVFSHF